MGMDRNDPLDIEYNLECAMEYLRNWKPPLPEERHPSIKTWDKLMEERIYYG